MSEEITQDDKKQTYMLKDVDVNTVGLVARGANRKRFFLTKSNDEEDNSMADQDDKTPVDALTEEQIKEFSKDVVVEETEGVVRSFLKGLFGDNVDGDDADNDDAPEVLVIPEELQKKLDKVDELVEGHKELAEKLEKAQQDLADANVTAEEKVFLAKADKLTSIGTDREEMAKFMVFLNKNDNEMLEWFENLMKGANAQLAEAGIYSEFGKSQSPEQDDDPIQALIKSGKAKTEEEAYLMLGEDQDAAQKLLKDRRTEVRTG